MELTNRVAIVTGAGSPSGIGWATARHLASQGAVVVVTDLADNMGSMSALLAELDATGRGSMAIEVDITDRAQIDECVNRVMSEFGRLDILVNNAGTTIGALPFLDITSEQWDTSYRVNLKGTADFCQSAIPAMIADRDSSSSGSGAIVNNASTAGLGAEAGFGAYNATKHAVVGLTKTIAAEFGADGIRCNAVCPGYVSTDMHLEATKRLAQDAGIATDEMAQRRYAGVALGRAGTTDEIAATIAFLASPAAGYITGAAIPVSGGTPVGL